MRRYLKINSWEDIRILIDLKILESEAVKNVLCSKFKCDFIDLKNNAPKWQIVSRIYFLFILLFLFFFFTFSFYFSFLFFSFLLFLRQSFFNLYFDLFFCIDFIMRLGWAFVISPEQQYIQQVRILIKYMAIL